jgi:Na+-transporting NADH:ubiquinone oxidoreductase subunit A
MLIKLKGGLDLPITGVAGRQIEAAPPSRHVALVGLDYVDLKPSLEVESGDSVRLGQTLFTQRGHPELQFTAPGSGRIAAINRGPRRTLESVVIELADEDDSEEPGWPEARGSRDPARLRAALMASGLWSAFRTRPYSRVPAPDATLNALFVTALDTQPLAPDPVLAISEREADFEAGLDCLCALCEGPVFLCTAPDVRLPVPAADNLRHVQFAGRHPAGLPGTHMHFLAPQLSAAADTWYVGYQDVLSIGRLYRLGVPSRERVIAVAGPATSRPRLLRTRLGADLAELLGTEFTPDVRVISGSVLSGRRANPNTRYLGRYHNQVTLVSEVPASGRARGWTQRAAALGRGLLGDLLKPGEGFAAGAPDTSLNGRAAGMLPVERFDEVWPLTDPPAALLRALLTGDTEGAMALGCLALDEEDLALCAYVCPSKQNYGAALRDTLQAIEQAQR